MCIFAAEPPGAEKPPILPPAARTLWQGMINTGFLAIASPTSRAVFLALYLLVFLVPKQMQT
jgi:hypothetical protein